MISDMFDVIKRIKSVFIFGLFLGIYQYKMFAPDSILLSLIGGIEIKKTSDLIPYIEVIEWLFVISFFVLLSAIKLREKAQLYIYEVIRCKSYRRWCGKLYKNVLLYTLRNAAVCIIIWYLMDVIVNKKADIPILAIALFLLHLLCCVAIVCMLESVVGRSEYIYLPVIIEGGTILLASKCNTLQIWFWGTWGMYKRSRCSNQLVGFPISTVILLELAIIAISYLLSIRNMRGER